MRFYDEKVLPHLINKACTIGPIMKLRQQIVPRARGVVLEIGMGSGVNLPYYRPEQVDFVWGLEPSQGMREKARSNLQKSPVEVRWLDLPGEQIPLDDNSVDTVLITYTLCTIPDWQAALQQMHRVLKPGGLLLFCEHGRAPDHGVSKWQDRITPVWKTFAGGCHLNRNTLDMLTAMGFEVREVEQLYIRNTPKIAGYMYYGEAVPLK
ncbi:MAG: class I SAM-dependent methyltransferase [Marinobacter sp.]|nr:class I SAM-dependent methyltransferase [Marinobacter sp.]